MMDFLVFAMALAGFNALCVSMERHAKQVVGHAPDETKRRGFSALGWALLALALALAVYYHGASIGTAVWFGLMTVAAFIVGLLLSYRPRPLLGLGGAALAVALLLLV
ncbi:DUF3325 family protein [Azoarcus indigens]|uniref:Uncharacterized protein DUF3325 n=1 Tax=Azoarcus indigens TaxID=29545 RepID=A0A4R6EDB6_9RHOO|nr:DUF3325 domain-containing protein [Azoarcus indigens]NMG63637.1 DUF3325 family protein [Azoarcus indigens]TDN56171.1 uncharacterized protein DUF3325 [Azoarcus indigens]